MKFMKHPFLLAAAITLAALITGPLSTLAADLTYPTLVPQAGDQDVQIQHKQALDVAPKVYSSIAATGTTSLACASLDRITIGTAGSADSKLVLTDGTNAVATISTAAQSSLPFNIVITTGTLNIVATGTTAPKVTVSYR
jgi:hypothetical protein